MLGLEQPDLITPTIQLPRFTARHRPICGLDVTMG
jgi:hypothetical protein